VEQYGSVTSFGVRRFTTASFSEERKKSGGKAPHSKSSQIIAALQSCKSRDGRRRPAATFAALVSGLVSCYNEAGSVGDEVLSWRTN
jgi:hypothetical protein